MYYMYNLLNDYLGPFLAVSIFGAAIFNNLYFYALKKLFNYLQYGYPDSWIKLGCPNLSHVVGSEWLIWSSSAEERIRRKEFIRSEYQGLHDSKLE